MRIRLPTPLHPFALPAPPLHSLGNVPIYTAMPTPTFIPIAMSSMLPPPPLAPGVTIHPIFRLDLPLVL